MVWDGRYHGISPFSPTSIPYFCVIFFPIHPLSYSKHTYTQFDSAPLVAWLPACLFAGFATSQRDIHLFFHSAYSVCEEPAIEQQAEGNSKRFVQSSTTSKITKLKLDGIRDEHKRYKCVYLSVFVYVWVTSKRTDEWEGDSLNDWRRQQRERWGKKKKTFNEQQNLIKVIKLVFKCTLHLAFYMCTLSWVEWMRVEHFCIGAVLLLLFLLLLIFLIFCKRFVSSSL